MKDKKIQVFSCTHIGFNHEKKGKECEDYSGFRNGKELQIIAVADGHGSDNYPRTKSGSKFAVESAIFCVEQFYLENKNFDFIDSDKRQEKLVELSKRIWQKWRNMVSSDLFALPLNINELENVAEKYKLMYNEKSNVFKAYGSTLLVAAQANSFWFGLQIGDGKLVVIDSNGESLQPIEEDINCYSNVTTSLSDANALSEFRFYADMQLPTAIFIGTDGIDNSYPSKEELYGLYESVLKIFTDSSIDNPTNEIADYLPILTRKGSGDDVSMAGMIFTPSILIKSENELTELESSDQEIKNENWVSFNDNSLISEE
jgi:serine/threonine protein phosphatase PrpC